MRMRDAKQTAIISLGKAYAYSLIGDTANCMSSHSVFAQARIDGDIQEDDPLLKNRGREIEHVHNYLIE